MEEIGKLIVEKFNAAVKLRDPQESTGNLLLKLFYNLVHIFMSFRELLVERLDQVLPPERRTQESIVDFLLKQFNQLLHTMDNIWALFVDKFNQVLPPERRTQESIVDFLLKQFNQLLHTMDNIWALFVDKFNQVLPPESRSQILHVYVHVALTRVLPATLVLLFLCCCHRYCSKYGRSAGKMMKAPGRKGAVIARASFQDNPRAYFRNLRGKK